jgi:serine protease Do
VIITADGLVLSQYHVSHQADPADPTKDATPGTKMTVILHDGTRSEAERLGGDAVLDLSLLKLTGPGPYPHAPLSDWADVTAGETVLKAGHPRGYFGGQPPLLRRGRVLWSGEGMFVADAPLDGGDSGGPYFDADGRLIGIVFSSWLPASVAGNGTAYTRGVIPQSAHALSQLRGRIEPMARGEVRRPSPDVEFAVRQMQVRAAKIPALTADRWSQGATTLASYREVVSVAKSGVVAILDGDSAVVLGTVVAAEGLVVTVASRVPHDARCRLPDGRLVQAKVVGVHPAFDLALLRLPAAGLEAVGWAEANPAVGSIVVAAGADDLPLAVGIVSAGRRDLPGPHPATVTRPQRQPATLPEVIGSAVQGRGYWVEFAEGEAVRAGIEPGDVILSIGGMAVRSHQELARCVRGRAAGDRLPVRLLRSGRHVELRLTLRARSVIGFTNREAGYPTVFEHDLPLDAAECGSPVVGLDGKAVGLTVARLGGSGCMAVPADVVQRLLPELKAGRPLAALPPIKAPPADGANTGGPIGNPSPSAGAPTKLTIEALRQGLADWRDRFRSLSVEYDVVSEAHVEPLQLLAWNMHSIRDYQERHQVAFDGRKRFQEIQGPSVMPFYAPLDLVVPDPKAPPEVKRAVEDARTLAVSQGKEDVDRLFAGIVGQPELSRLIYDGETCVRWSQGARKMMKVPAPRLSIFSTYLANLGLQPPDANPGERPTAQQAFWFPASLDLYETLRVLPVEQEIDGVACVILEAELNRELEGRGVRIQDRIWFASNLGFSPVRWEQREDGVLTGVRENSDFDEFALNCWLPWEATWTLYAPKWAAERYRNQPAYGFNMRLRKARVNEVPQALFQTVEQ